MSDPWKPKGICDCRECGSQVWMKGTQSGSFNDYLWFCENEACHLHQGKEQGDLEIEPDWVRFDPNGLKPLEKKNLLSLSNFDVAMNPGNFEWLRDQHHYGHCGCSNNFETGDRRRDCLTWGIEFFQGGDWRAKFIGGEGKICWHHHVSEGHVMICPIEDQTVSASERNWSETLNLDDSDFERRLKLMSFA